VSLPDACIIADPGGGEGLLAVGEPERDEQLRLLATSPGFITGTGRLAASQAADWCMVVEPSTITSAPSSSIARSASALSLAKTTSSLPSSSSARSGRVLIERSEATRGQKPYSVRVFS
jgi:hypothetical protein